MPATPHAAFHSRSKRVLVCTVTRLALLAALVWIATGARPAGAESAAAASRPPAAAVIDRFQTVLLDAMKRGGSLGYEGRYRLLEPVIVETFDLAFMSRAALGSHWKELGEPDRAALVQAFTRMTVANYAAQFSGWDRERFETGESVDGGQGTTVVRTRIIEGDGHFTALDYRLRPGATGFRVVDVFLSGSVSQLALHRADYNSVFNRGGLPALLASLDDRVKKLASGAEKPKAR